MSIPTNASIQDIRRSNIKYAAVTINITGIVTDLSLKDNTQLFNSVEYGRELVLRNSESILIRFNSNSDDTIELLSNEGINMSGVPVSDIYITTTSAGAKIRVWMVGWN